MHDDVACIIAEIRRLAMDFPGESTPPTVAGRSGWFSGLHTGVAVATVLRLNTPARHALALSAQGYSASQIARLTATTSGVAAQRVRRAREELGVSERFGVLS
ncbi:hypothetical protein GCM10022223_70370 [Kineosporia mesophila]|uniref:RNA polymerase sigma factor 70 region 4 type 2 domain-containing protein n=1 Tax=Kineosporia mesophila TaxID=566012 RepID=A0ABP7AVU1_9ACTN|nr:hypothetical protein [Kineosporia mesophila]MCD5354129.1 hypothetical protein [Kineosporia mesophila]